MKKDKTIHLSYWRLRIVKLLFICFFIVLLFKYFKIQVSAHTQYLAMAAKQHWVGREIPAERGKILLSDGFPLAVDINAYLLFAVPEQIKDAKLTSEKLVDIFGYDSQAKDEEGMKKDKENAIAEIQEKLGKKELKWVSINRKILQEQKDKIEALKIEGLGFDKEYKRYYPEGSMASHVLGFVGSDNQGNEQGYYGIEGYYNGTLKGLPGKLAEEKDPAGRPIPIGEYIPLEPENGEDVVLTLNHELQYMVERKIKEGVEKYDAKSGTVIILNPKNSEVIAMADYPNYAPDNWRKWANNNFKEGELADKYKIGKDVFSNLAVAQLYEPGSVFKPIIMSAGIELGKVTPDTKFQSGPLEVQGNVIRTWNNQYYGQETMAEVLQHSDNTGAAWLGMQLGSDVVYDWFKKLHLGESLDIKLEDEATGLIKPKESWTPIDLATASFGQGISINPLQLVAAYGAIANGGVYHKPQIVKEVRGKIRTTVIKPSEDERVFSEETAITLVDMLTSVVEKGEFKFAVLPGYKIAGKTGTAQIPRNGAYDPNKTNCTFVGFAQAAHPQFVMLVKLEEPTASTYSAETAVPLWMDIAKELFIYYGITPSS